MPLVVPLVVPPRVVPRVVPRLGAEYFEVGLEETVLGGWSTKDVSVVLGEGQLVNPGLDGSIAIATTLSQGVSRYPILTRMSFRHLPVGVAHFLPLCRVC